MPIQNPAKTATAQRLQTLTRAECLVLLADSNLGRIAFTERALPAIRPVHYALVGHQLVLRTADRLGRRLDGQVVAFEVDDVDTALGSGWSVLVTGTARLVSAPGDLMRSDAVPFVPLAGPDRTARVCIVPGEITGRRLGRPYVD